MLKVGFVGLGIMGKPMVMNMLKAGIDVTVSDLKQELVDEVVAAGGKSAASVKELAKGKDAVFTILPTAAIVQDVFTKRRHPGRRRCRYSRRRLQLRFSYRIQTMP